MTTQINEPVYKAAHTTAVLVDRSRLGLLKITGDSRLDLIHRMSTNQVNGLQAGEGVATILTTDIARIIDRLLLYTSSDTVYCLTSENNAEAIARYLMRFVFFNDDFHLEDVSAQTAVFGIYGPQAAPKLNDAGFSDTDLPLHHWRQLSIGGTTAYLHRTDPLNGDGYFVMCRQADKETVRQQLVAAGLVVATEDDFETLRIEAGLPRFGHELTPDYIPLEANLWADVSFSKGCYIGQEIIARMESRGKLAKQLTPLQLNSPVEPGTTLTAGGKKAGIITSVAHGPDAVFALGYVKTAVLNEAPDLQAGEAVAAIS